jgi:hypothetical protein
MPARCADVGRICQPSVAGRRFVRRALLSSSLLARSGRENGKGSPVTH